MFCTDSFSGIHLWFWPCHCSWSLVPGTGGANEARVGLLLVRCLVLVFCCLMRFITWLCWFCGLTSYALLLYTLICCPDFFFPVCDTAPELFLMVIELILVVLPLDWSVPPDLLCCMWSVLLGYSCCLLHVTLCLLSVVCACVAVALVPCLIWLVLILVLPLSQVALFVVLWYLLSGWFVGADPFCCELLCPGSVLVNYPCLLNCPLPLWLS
jgi:hypothetical protein